MAHQSLVTLNRTLAVQVKQPAADFLDQPSASQPMQTKVVKMQAFTGQFQHRTRQNEVTYKVTAIHMPDPIVLDVPIFVDFASSAVVATQEVQS